MRRTGGGYRAPDTERGRVDEPAPGILVGPERLPLGRASGTVRLVDLRSREAYEEGHAPGAAHVDLADLGAHRDGRDNVLLAADDFARLMSGLGVSSGTTVVAYDDQWGLAAARLVWSLHRYGHAAAAVLDGGWDRWREEGRPTVSGRSGRAEPDEAGTSFTARPDPDVYADREWISSGLARQDLRLLDTRSRSEFDAGHIPGASCWDWLNAVPVGSWACARDPDELRAELAGLDVRPEHEVVVYCRSGMRAAHTWVALRHAAFSRVRLYDGSWQDWNAGTARAPQEGAGR